MNWKSERDDMSYCIEVTQEDIDKGLRQCGEACPIALAMLRAIPTARDIFVDQKVIQFSIDNGMFSCRTDKTTEQFILDFDNAISVNPSLFTLHEERWTPHGYSDVEDDR
jgi:hypothetical protein